MKYGSVAAMVAWIDRKETKAARNRRFRKAIRGLPPKERAFASALRRVFEVEKGPEIEHREKILKALKIKDRTYRRRLDSLSKKVG